MSLSWYKRLVNGARAQTPSAPREILVVDDQPEIRAVLRDMLERLGWTVQSAAGPDEALTVLASRPGQVALALIDVIMPGTDGVSLALRLRQTYPRLEIVMLSGHLSDETRWVISEQGFRFLPKPFAFVQLRDVVAEVLGDPAPRGALD